MDEEEVSIVGEEAGRNFFHPRLPEYPPAEEERQVLFSQGKSGDLLSRWMRGEVPNRNQPPQVQAYCFYSLHPAGIPAGGGCLLQERR